MTAYSDLLARVADWLNRDDLTSAQIDVFIRLAEARLNRVLIVPEREAVATATADSDRAPLPGDFWAMRALHAGGQVDPLIGQMSLVELRRAYAGTNAGTGDIRHFAISGNDLILGPSPRTETVLTLDYFATIPALTTGNTSNWLIAAHPDIYLSAVLAEACIFFRDAEGAGLWDSRTEAKIREADKAGRRKTTGAAPLAPRAYTNLAGVRA